MVNVDCLWVMNGNFFLFRNVICGLFILVWVMMNLLILCWVIRCCSVLNMCLWEWVVVISRFSLSLFSVCVILLMNFDRNGFVLLLWLMGMIILRVFWWFCLRLWVVVEGW